MREISIHALREEGDERASRPRCVCPRFLSTPSARRATAENLCQLEQLVNDFYPRPPRGGRRFAARTERPQRHISIHALREEGDDRPVQGPRRTRPHFYPRPPRGGRRCHQRQIHRSCQFLSTPSARRATFHLCYGYHPAGFLSTPSARRATPWVVREGKSGQHFYPRPPRGGRPNYCWGDAMAEEISIHALREEGDNDDRGCENGGG